MSEGIKSLQDLKAFRDRIQGGHDAAPDAASNTSSPHELNLDAQDLTSEEVTPQELWKLLDSPDVAKYASKTVDAAPDAARDDFRTFHNAYKALRDALRTYDRLNAKGEDLTESFVNDLQERYLNFAVARHTLEKSFPLQTPNPNRTLNKAPQGLALDSLRISHGPNALSVSDIKKELNDGSMRSYADMKDATRRGVEQSSLDTYQQAYKKLADMIRTLEGVSAKGKPLHANTTERLQRDYDALVAATHALEVTEKKQPPKKVDTPPAAPSAKVDAQSADVAKNTKSQTEGLDTRRVQNIDDADLVGRLNEEGARQQILWRMDQKLAEIDNTLHDRGIKARTNKDLEGYGSLVTSWRKLHKTILTMPNGTFQREDAKEVWDLMQIIEAHADTVNNALSSAPKTPDTPPEPVPSKPEEGKENITPPGMTESFGTMLQRIDTYNARIRNAAQGNPAALVDTPYVSEYQPLLVAVQDTLKRLYERAVAGADPDPILEAELVTSLARLDTLSEEISAHLGGKKEQSTPDTPPTPDANKAPGPVQPSPDALKNAIAGGMQKGAPETIAALATLREKNEAYKQAREAYEKAIDAHYGAYRSNTGPFMERAGRGMRKLFGLGPKHGPALDALYKTMNDARIDFSKSRFEAMDARIKGRIAQNPGDKNLTEWSTSKENPSKARNLTEWNEGLKRREIARTIVRSSEGFIRRQYNALSPAQQGAVEAARLKNSGEKSERRMTYAQIGVAAVSGLFVGLKAKTAIATGGASLIAGYVGLFTGNRVGDAVSWWKDRRIKKLNDDLEYVSKVRGERVDFDSTSDYDATLRMYGNKIIATEESKDAQVKAARLAGAAVGGLAAGGAITAFEPNILSFGGVSPLDTTDVAGSGDSGGSIIKDQDRGPMTGNQQPPTYETPEGKGDFSGVEKDTSRVEPPSRSEPTPAPLPSPEPTPAPESVHEMYAVERNDDLYSIHEEKTRDLFTSKEEQTKFLEEMYNLNNGEMRGDTAHAEELREKIGWDRKDTKIDVINWGGDGHEQTKVDVTGMREIASEWLEKERGGPAGAPASPSVEDVVPKEVVPGQPDSTSTVAKTGEQTTTQTSDTREGTRSFAERLQENPNEPPSQNVEDHRTPDQIAADDRMFRELKNGTTAVAENSDAPVVQGGRTDSDLGVSASSAESTNSVADPNLIAAQREQIVRALDGNRPEPGFLSSLFGTTVAERGAHDVLKEMTLGEIKTDILNAPPAARAAFAAENNIDTASMTRWVNYLNQVSQADTTQDPSLKLDAYLDKIAEHLSKTPATPRA